MSLLYEPLFLLPLPSRKSSIDTWHNGNWRLSCKRLRPGWRIHLWKSLTAAFPMHYKQDTQIRSSGLWRVLLLDIRDWGQWFYSKWSHKKFRPEFWVWRVMKMFLKKITTVPEKNVIFIHECLLLYMNRYRLLYMKKWHSPKNEPCTSSEQNNLRLVLNFQGTMVCHADPCSHICNQYKGLAGHGDTMISALRRLRQEDLMLQTSLDYTAHSRVIYSEIHTRLD